LFSSDSLGPFSPNGRNESQTTSDTESKQTNKLDDHLEENSLNESSSPSTSVEDIEASSKNDLATSSSDAMEDAESFCSSIDPIKRQKLDDSKHQLEEEG